ncbi:MAG: hypothetical protein KC619_07805, partial [Myxococcales bacterium]|nr:hypothetical protein [Myxococcales bacterium]
MQNRRMWGLSLTLVLVLGLGAAGLFACGGGEETPSPSEPSPTPDPDPRTGQGGADPAPAASADVPDDLPNGLLLAYSQFPVRDGRIVPEPGAARLEILTRSGGEWHVEVLEDDTSNV